MMRPLCLTLMLICLAAQYSLAGRVTRVGNAIKPGTSGADFDKTAFLLHNTALADGVLFAFSAYFRNLNPVFFQLWRLQTGRRYRLVHEWLFNPALSGGKEDLYIHSRQGLACVAVQADDRLGLYFAESPGSVTYTFDPTDMDSLRYVVDDGALRPEVGDTIAFDSLVYPYRFSAAAYIDSDMSNYNLSGPISCPQTLKIPSSARSVGPIGGVGSTGATGPQGIPGITGMPGETGPAGPRGLIGIMGQQGPAGPVGPAGPKGDSSKDGKDGKDGKNGEDGAIGPVGPAGPPGTKGEENEVKAASRIDTMLESCSWCADLLNPYLILGLLLWLALVTILLLVVICCATYRRRQNNAKYAQNLKWAGAQTDLWKNYDPNSKGSAAARVPSYENGGMEPTYDSIEEGRTAF